MQHYTNILVISKTICLHKSGLNCINSAKFKLLGMCFVFNRLTSTRYLMYGVRTCAIKRNASHRYKSMQVVSGDVAFMVWKCLYLP